MKASELRVVAPDPQRNADEVVELCAKTFGRYFDFRKDLRDWHLLNSHYDWQASTIGLVDDRIVTHYGVWDYQMRVGSSVVRCAGVGCVATDGEFRKRGLMGRTIPPSLAAMRRLGYDLTMLFGLPDFYGQFGYVRAWNERTWQIACDKLPPDLPPVKVEAFDGGPKLEIARLHNRANAEMTGSAVRPTYTRPGHVVRPIQGLLWRDARGRAIGHVIVCEDAGRVCCLESTGQALQVLSVLKEVAINKHLKELAFETAPWDSPVIRCLRQRSCRCETKYVRDGGAMIQCLNLRSCLERLAGEFARRLGESELAEFRGELAIALAGDTVGLRIEPGVVRVVEKVGSRNFVRGGQEVAQLLIGTDEPMELCEVGKIRLGGHAQRLARVMFPNCHPCLHRMDRY